MRSPPTLLSLARPALLLLPALALSVAASGQSPRPSTAPTTLGATRPAADRATLESNLSKLLTRATLDGSFTSTGAGADPRKLSGDRYVLGEVRKIGDGLWRIEAQMKVAGRDLTIPMNLPIEWAGDTPVIVLDDFAIPGMGVFSARVLFHGGHYSGYWKHGDRGGNLFGVIRPAGE